MSSPVHSLNHQGIETGVEWLCRVEPALRPHVDRNGLPPLWARRPGFSSLVRIIIEQQVSLASAKAQYRRLQNGLGTVSPRNIARCGVDGLRGLGMTRQKSAYVAGLARQILDSELDLSSLVDAPDEHTRRTLLAIKGIGPWTVDIYQLMALGRPDIWPCGDIALLTALQSLHGLATRPDNTQAAALTRPWSPWRSVGARVLWHGYLRGSLRHASSN